MVLKKYKCSSQVITLNVCGYLEANSKKEAIEKFQSGDCDDYEEFPTQEEVNIECEEI